MKSIYTVLLMAMWAGSVACGNTDNTYEIDTPSIDAVFFAQHHVQEPDHPYFKLVGELDALIKVQVYSDFALPSPLVVAKLELEDQTQELVLAGPTLLPPKPECDPVLMPHSYHDSFTALISKDWVRPGLKVTVELRDVDYTGTDDDDQVFTNCVTRKYVTVLDQRVFNELRIGAPSRVTMQMFDIHYFGLGRGADYPEGWEREMEAKLPLSDLIIHRVRDIVFREIVMPPQLGGPSAKYSSPEDYLKRTGKPYDGEQGIALRWVSALKAAGGGRGLWRPYHINIAGVYSGGQAGGYRSCANLHRHGVILHELGHTFGLPHWANRRDYPYKRTMYGVDQGEETGPNAGPTWAFDLGRRAFIPPRREFEGEQVWKNDPMQGGGKSRTPDYLYTHFSDYSMRRMQARMESATYWNPNLEAYARWNQDTAAYENIADEGNVLWPVERDVEVITLLCSANLVVPDANIIYPVIGPYRACLIKRFNADVETDRKAAEEVGYTAQRCNIALRVTQGGKTTTYLMPARVTPGDDPLKAFNATAINLPARDGDVTAAELLYCPELIAKGITDDSTVLCRWGASASDDTIASRQ